MTPFLRDPFSPSAGTSHSPSDLNDPAFNDILTDLSQNTAGDLFNVSVYGYSSAPAQYATAESILSAGESALGGQPFDFLIVGGPSSFQPPRTWLSLGFNNEIGNLDGITALRITEAALNGQPFDILLSATPPVSTGRGP